MWWRIVAMMAAASFVGSLLGSLTEIYLAIKGLKNMQQQALKGGKVVVTSRKPPSQQPAKPQGDGDSPNIKTVT